MDLRGFCGMMLGVSMVAVRHMGMMRGPLMITGLMMFSGFTMVMGRVIMVLGGLVMMMRSFS